jgi:flagellar protein FlaJ
MIEEIRTNVDTEIEMLREISTYYRRLDNSSPSEAKLLYASIDALSTSIKILNSSIPKMLTQVSVAQKLSPREGIKFENIHFKIRDANVAVTLNIGDREAFLAKLSINEQLLKRLKKKQKIKEEKFEEFKATRGYLKISNRFFLDTAQNLIKKGNFAPLSVTLKKANMDILFSTYVAMMLFTTLIAFVFSLFLTVFFLFFNFDFLLNSFPPISLASGSIISRIPQVIWMPLVIPLVVFSMIYYYPSSEKDTLEKRIDQELPFAVVHMSAISGSGIEPSEIFKIIALSKEYPFLRKEIRKIMNQVNLYGYDLVTALTNVSKTTPSSKLAELFSGLSTTITSGGDLQNFFEKRSETLLLGYRLEREKFIKLAEAFMDIYISVVIAAPMVIMILLVIITASEAGSGFTSTQIGLGIVLVIGIINSFFLMFLKFKQPGD